MTREQIIEMAKEVGVFEHGPLTRNWNFKLDQLVRFAALVAAAEREACAKLCDSMAYGWKKSPWPDPLAGYVASSNCAFEIRARGQQ